MKTDWRREANHFSTNLKMSFLDRSKLKSCGSADILDSLLECNCNGRRAEEIFAEETKHQA